jgi:hypothetical protein
MKKVIYPKITVRVTGENPNFYSTLNRVVAAMDKAGVPLNIRKKYVREAAEGYDCAKMLSVTAKWVKVK